MSFNHDGVVNFKKVSQWDIIKKQVQLKANIYQGSIVMIIFAQIFGLFLSLGSTSSSIRSGMSDDSFFIEVSQVDFNGQAIIVFTILGLVGMAFSLGLRQTKDVATSFISNGKTNTMSNVIFLSLLSFAAGVLAYALTICMKVIVLYVQGINQFVIVELPTISEILAASLATALYAMFFAMIAYFIGELYDSNKFLFVVFIGITFMIAMAYGVTGIDAIKEWIFTFIGREKSLFFFSLKILAIFFLLFSTILLLSRKVEVRK